MGNLLDIFGANKAAKAQSKAADQQIAASKEATDKSLAMQQEQFDRVWGATEVSRTAGNAATAKLADLSGLGGGSNALNWSGYLEANPDVAASIAAGNYGGEGGLAGAAQRHFTEYGQKEGRAAPTVQTTTDWLRSTPGYDVNFKEGQRAQNASLASRGGLLSGDAGRAAIQYGQDYGNRIFNQERNALQSIAGLGQSATAQGNAAGAQQASAGQNALFQNAGNLSSSYQNKADATSGFWGTMSGTFGSNALAGMAGSFLKGGF